MAPPEKVTAEQKDYLLGLVDMYLETKKHGGWAKFWPSVFQPWFKLWPEIEDTTILDKENRDAALASAILTKQGSLKNWFRNHALRMAPVTKKASKGSKNKRGPQLLELYSTEYYDTRVAAHAAAAAAREPAEATEEGKPPQATAAGEGKSLSVIRAEVKKAFEDESVEFQAEFTAKHRQLLLDRAAKKKAELDAPPAAPTPASYEAGIKSIPIHFKAFMREVESSGWSFVLLCGGPDPMGAGRISTTALHCGSNLVGLSHSQYDPNFMAHHVPAFGNFLTTCYTPEDCSSRALIPASTEIAAKVSPHPATLPVTQRSPSIVNENPGSPSPSIIATSPPVTTTCNVSPVSASPVPDTTSSDAHRSTAIATIEAAHNEAAPNASLANQVAAAGTEQIMEFDWDSFDLSSLPNYDMSGGMAGGVYPSLSEELAAPLSDLLLPTPSFLQSNRLLANAPYSFSAQDPSLVLASLPAASTLQRDAIHDPAVAPPVQQSGVIHDPAVVIHDPAVAPPVQQSGAIHDPAVAPPVQLAQREDTNPPAAVPPPPDQQVGPALSATDPGPSHPTVLAPLNAETGNRKRSRIDGLDESVIVDTKRARKSQKRTEVEAITHNLSKGKENRIGLEVYTFNTLQGVQGNASHLHMHVNDILGTLALGNGMACDILISVSLVYYLNKWRSEIRRTENIIDSIIVYVVGIGVVTSIFSSLIFITWLALPHQFIFMLFFSIHSKLHVNSFLVTLNARSGLRNRTASESEYENLELSIVLISTTTCNPTS
ncbi:hypothetical protein AB1N83_013087 [Pleurotus pulmonarius]